MGVAIRRKIGLPAILFALAPRSWQRGVLVLLAVMFAPLILIVLMQAVTKLLELVPVVWTLGALVLLYILGRRFFGRR